MIVEPEPFTKVTIILENGERTTTLRIPKARGVTRVQSAIEKDVPWPSIEVEYSETSMHFGLSLMGLFDEVGGYIMTEEYTTMAKEVANSD